MLKVEISSMSVEDVDGVMVVESLSFKIPWSRNAFTEEIANNKFARYIIAKADGRIVGYAGMWKIFDEGHVTNVAVHPEFRGAGIGGRLLEYLIDSARAEGILSMTLEVRKSNIIAQKLYSRYGFTESGHRKGYYADNGEDAIIMWKHSMD